MITGVIAGGQSGADIGAWRAAKEAGLYTCGVMPVGFMTEEGPRPEYAAMYNAEELPPAEFGRHSLADQYRARTQRNLDILAAAKGLALVFDSDVSISRGTRLVRREIAKRSAACGLLEICLSLQLPDGLVTIDAARSPAIVASVIADRDIESLFVGGNRASKATGIEAFVLGYMRRLFACLRGEEADVD